MAEETRSTRKAASDAGKAKGDIDEKWSKVLDQGYLGASVDPHANEEYTLQTGPDSPAAVADEHSRAELPAAGGGETAK